MNINKINESMYFTILFIWLFFMLMFPGDFQIVKYLSLGILLVIITKDIIFLKIKLNKRLIKYLFLWIACYTFFLLLGIKNNYKIDFALINIYFIGPISAVLLSLSIDSKLKFRKLNFIIIIVTLLILIVDVIYVLNITNIINLPFELKSSIFGSAQIDEGKIEFRIDNQNSLMFLLPYSFVIFLSKEYETNFQKKILIAILFFGFIIAVLSGRRAFQAILILSVIIYNFFILLNKKRIKNPLKSISKNTIKNTILILVVLALSIGLVIKVLEIEGFFEALIKTFLSAFDKTTKSGRIRDIQGIKLREAWINNFILGAGLSAHVKDYIRSSETKWAYEWVYLALLFQTGIVGGTIFFSYVFNICKKIFKVSFSNTRKINGYYLGILVGFLSFIIAGASNPLAYNLWAWFFALTAYNFNPCKLLNE